ncbi:hypothetical protein [Nocardiopsis sp. L17-MgMaSL7]|uniref:hypothetical protein n=1 Tax=Nocardiopsis sp. L17-MgMaSL7 TaxID=1938893 RepID=UPI000D7097E6|nr:hypothetical protein [Nocardiopsis sp. L17-MgMaSL7]PWV55487.1 hypothetical protein BDW27_103491 [Nocardiopsis sp. L17-MgMaSL7]
MTDNPQRHQEEIAAALRASRELGPEYDEAVAASLVERVDDTIEERVKHHVARRTGADEPRVGVASNTVRMVLALVCLGISIPITAIVASLIGGAMSVFMVWAGLIGFYLIAVLGLRR